ncbi:unnamed protein product [Phaedon cochleariae]|uniref:protein-histidine N-methyltransferase n=1 Tax=Phaedon cochleariae TaxID=80249 RepID=A0A9P0DFT6_PHACE|nr:unnamed protein product [Phaedon cochleariae]
MFKFGFSSDNDENSEEIAKELPEMIWKESNEIIIHTDSNPIKNGLGQINTKIVVSSGYEVKYLCSKAVINTLLKNEQSLDDSVLKSEKNHSDLLPAVYEGGFKIWECTYDLLNYIDEQKINFKEVNVLDLGCGAGIIGITTLLCGAKCYFQDYNSDVIQYITIPNVLLNSVSGMEKCKFYSGDWRSFSDLVEKALTTPEDKFDYIFTSETIYNTECYPKLHRVFEKLLKKSGYMYLFQYNQQNEINCIWFPLLFMFLDIYYRYLAAKSFYFGVGGGITLFQDFLDEQKVFKYTTCWKCEEGVSREIIKIEFI